MEENKIILEMYGKVTGIEADMKHLVANQIKSDKCYEALHNRVDIFENDIKNIKTDQKIFKRDIKWTLGIGAAILASIKWLVSIFIK